MTAQRDPYVRVYYSIVDDPKFESVYDDDGALALWLRLLIVADATYPAPAPIPHGVKPRALKKLTTVGLVDRLPGHRYRMRGLASERDRRSLAGKAGADARWNATASGNAMRSHSESHSAPSRSSPSNSEQLRSSPTPRKAKSGLTPVGDVLRRFDG